MVRIIHAVLGMNFWQTVKDRRVFIRVYVRGLFTVKVDNVTQYYW